MALTTFDDAMDNAQEFTLYSPDGKEHAGFWSDIRVDRATIPEGWKAYDIRESDDEEENGWLGTIEENYVIVNHAGTFLTQEVLPLEEKEDGRKWANLGEDAGSGEWDYSFS